MILPKEKIIFIHIPKTGGSAIEYALLASQRILLDEKEVRQSVFANLSEAQLKEYLIDNLTDKAQHMTASWYKQRVPDYDSYYKFAVVRNPYDRFVSEYYWQKSLDGGAKLKHHKLTVDMLRNRNKIHYKKQIDFITDEDGNIIVDDVFRFENFQSIVASLQERLGKQLPWLILKASVDRPPFNLFMNENSKAEHFVKYYYKKDFERLEYST